MAGHKTTPNEGKPLYLPNLIRANRIAGSLSRDGEHGVIQSRILRNGSQSKGNAQNVVRNSRGGEGKRLV